MRKYKHFFRFIVILLLIQITGFLNVQAVALSSASSNPAGNISNSTISPKESAPSQDVISINVKDFGAKGTGHTLDTRAIQAAIDFAASSGGGEVLVPAGTYIITTIFVKSNVTLNISSGATIAVSTNKSNWTTSNMPAIRVQNSENVTITGGGIIDGGGLVYYDKTGHLVNGHRPNGIISLFNCQHVIVSGITLRNSAGWTLAFTQCDYAIANNVIVRNRDSNYGFLNDGINIVDSRHVLVNGCDIMTGDDGICVKSIGGFDPSFARDCYDILVKNCIIATAANSTKIGTETTNNIYDITFNNITINKYVDNTGAAAIAIESNDGGSVHDIICQNYTINYCDTPIFIASQDRQCNLPHSSNGQLYNITLQNINCLYSMKASQINTQQDYFIENIILDNISIHNNETYSNTAFPEYLNGSYPEAWSYGQMPAYGLFARNVVGLTIKNQVFFYDDSDSGRPMGVFENVVLNKIDKNEPTTAMLDNLS